MRISIPQKISVTTRPVRKLYDNDDNDDKNDDKEYDNHSGVRDTIT